MDNTSYDYGVEHAKSVIEQIEQLMDEYGYETLKRQWFVRGFKEQMESFDG